MSVSEVQASSPGDAQNAPGNSPAGFHLMTALKREATWSSVHGLVRSTGGGCFGPGAGVGAPVVGVSTSIASSSRAGVAAAEGVATLLRPAFFFGAMTRYACQCFRLQLQRECLVLNERKLTKFLLFRCRDGRGKNYCFGGSFGAPNP